MAKKFKSVAKSRKNTSGRRSTAKAQGSRLRAAAKARLSGKPSKPKKPTTTKKKKDPNEKRNYNFKLKPLEAREAQVLPDTYLTKKGLTLRKLMRNSAALFINNAEYVHLISMRKVKTKTGMPALVSKAITDDPIFDHNTKQERTVHIIGLDKRNEDGLPDYDKPVNKHRRVLVQCSCESYVFYGFEYANALHGAARIIYGNGEPPSFTNPGMSYGLCKHAYRVALEAVRKNA